MSVDRSGGGTDEGWRQSLTWQLALAALVAATPALDLYEAGTVSLGWLALGVVLWATAVGPAAASDFGQRVGAWFRAIGVLGRAAVILLFAAASVWGHATFDPPRAVVDSLVLGGMVGLAGMALWRDVRTD